VLDPSSSAPTTQTRPLYRRPVVWLGAVALIVVTAIVVNACTPQARRRPAGSVGANPSVTVPVPASSGPGNSAAPSGPPDLAGCVAARVSRLSLEARVGQLLMIGTPVANPGGLADTVRRRHLGGVFLAGRSTQPAAALRQGIQTLQTAAVDGIPLHVAVDQEGGQVQSLRGGDFPTVPSAVEQGRWDAATLRVRTTDWARRIAAAGVTIDLAPVADTVPAAIGAANPPIGAFDRQYGAAAADVAADIDVVVRAAQQAGVLTTLKHFPGLGRVRANTDTSTDAVDDVVTVNDPYLRPFASGIKAGTGAVMISSARYPQLDPAAIAAFSEPIVTGLLRQRLGFTGLIVSDDLGAAVAAGSVPVGERAVRFVRAGGDLVLTVRAADAEPMAGALLAAAQASPAFADRVTDATRHVVASKYRAGLLSCSGGG
jgi:beta-N-acetylhexosaminidase